ncbi:hypothetical protein SZ66_22950 [Pantoea ananatis]|nr:hypothetical protein [Pantoea ananatis]
MAFPDSPGGTRHRSAFLWEADRRKQTDVNRTGRLCPAGRWHALNSCRFQQTKALRNSLQGFLFTTVRKAVMAFAA